MREPVEKDACGTFVERLGVAAVEPATRPFDPGYDYASVDAYLDQCAHLISMFKLSVGWLVTREDAVPARSPQRPSAGFPSSPAAGPSRLPWR